MLGLFAKPIAGFADVVARGMHAVSHMATVERDPEHCKLLAQRTTVGYLSFGPIENKIMFF